MTPFGQLSETRFWAYLLLLPSVIVILAVVGYPTAYAFLLSVMEMRLTHPGPPKFVGFRNFATVIDDGVFWIALANTAVWVTLAIMIELALGIVAALCLNRGLRGTRIFFVLILLPFFLPNVVAGHVWALMLDSRFGVVNELLVRLGILSQYKAWFADPQTALMSTVLVEAWHGFPFFTMFILAGLNMVPANVYEAASLDGAGPIARFRLITLPLLGTVVMSAIILRVINLVNSPDFILILTGGGPGHLTQVLSLYAFQTAYRDFDFGYAAALSVVMFGIMMVFAFLYHRLDARRS